VNDDPKMPVKTMFIVVEMEACGEVNLVDAKVFALRDEAMDEAASDATDCDEPRFIYECRLAHRVVRPPVVVEDVP
jgi:hypothetical protein